MRKYLSILCLFFFFQNVAKAQDFEVSPVKVNFYAEAGQSQSATVTVRNHANKKTAFMLEAADLILKDKKDLKVRYSNERSCSQWLNINPSFFELNPSEEKEINITIQVPSDSYSTRWAKIIVKTTEEQSAFNVDKGIGAGILISPQIAIKIFQSPKSNKKYEAVIDQLKEITQVRDTARVFTVEVENIGDKIMKSKVYLLASNITSAEEFQYDPVKIEIYPDTKKTVKLYLPKNLPAGEYSLAAILDYPNAEALQGTQMIINVP